MLVRDSVDAKTHVRPVTAVFIFFVPLLLGGSGGRLTIYLWPEIHFLFIFSRPTPSSRRLNEKYCCCAAAGKGGEGVAWKVLHWSNHCVHDAVLPALPWVRHG